MFCALLHTIAHTADCDRGDGILLPRRLAAGTEELVSRRNDVTRVTNQPALTTSTGRVWLIVGALLSAVCLATLLVVATTHPAALIGAAIVLALYALLVVTRLAVRRQRLRLRLLAVVFAAIAVSTIVTLLLVISANVPR